MDYSYWHPGSRSISRQYLYVKPAAMILSAYIIIRMPMCAIAVVTTGSYAKCTVNKMKPETTERMINAAYRHFLQTQENRLKRLIEVIDPKRITLVFYRDCGVCSGHGNYLHTYHKDGHPAFMTINECLNCPGIQIDWKKPWRGN